MADKPETTETEEEQQIATMMDDPLLGPLKDTFGELLDEEKEPDPDKIEPAPEEEEEPKKKKEEKKETEEEVPDVEFAAPSDDDIPPVEKPEPEPEEEPQDKPAIETKVRKGVVTREDLKDAVSDIMEAARGKTEEKDTEKTDEEEMLPEQRRELELAEAAERFLPEKYKGQTKKTREFFSKLDAYVESAGTDTGRTFDENDYEFMEWVRKHRPDIEDVDRSTVQEKIIEERVEQRLSAKHEQAMEEVRAKSRAMEAQPVIEASVAKLRESLESKLASDDPLVKNVSDRTMAASSNIARTYLRLVSGLEPVRESEPSHSWLLGMIGRRAAELAKKPNEEKEKDGKIFVPPAEFAKLPKPQAERCWTFDYKDVLGFIEEEAVVQTEREVKKVAASLENLGFRRGSKAPRAPKATREPTPMPAAPTTQSRAPGAAAPAKDEDSTYPADDIFEILDLPKPSEFDRG